MVVLLTQSTLWEEDHSKQLESIGHASRSNKYKCRTSS